MNYVSDTRSRFPVVDELIAEAKNGSQNAFAMLCTQYEPLVSATIARFVQSALLCGLDADDLRQEALTALFGAVHTYRSDLAVSFGLYAKVCMRNRMISVLRKKPIPAEEEWEDGSVFEGDPESAVLDKENVHSLLRIIDESLTGYERSVFDLYLRDKSYREIASLLGKDEKSVANALYRIKKKLKTALTV